MKIFVVTLRDYPERTAWAREQLDKAKIPFQFFFGMNNLMFGLRSERKTGEITYAPDPEKMHPGPIGCFMSHYFLWHVVAYGNNEQVLIFEDDLILCDKFNERFEKTLANTPDDWDWIFVGHCCSEDKPKTEVAPGVWDVRYPMCTHAYAITKKAALKLIEQNDELHTNIDIQIVYRSFPYLKVYTFFPGLVEQNKITLQRAIGIDYEQR